MGNILDSIARKDTGGRYLGAIQRPAWSVQLQELKMPEFLGETGDRQWISALTLSVTFCASDAEHEHAYRISIECIAQALHEDVLKHLPHLRNCIMSGDKCGAFAAIADIERGCKP